jgi:thymidine kinase
MNNKKTIDNKRIYKEIHKRVGSKMKEQATEKDLDTQKALNKELEKTQDLQKKIKDISTQH